ncbi:MAG: thioredoxin [Clostridia bacterium]|nr:thioredoxin [Clostridia bacterium]
MCDGINTANFQREILQSEMPVLLDFFAPWCTPCRMLSAVLDDISEDYVGIIRVCRVNVDDEKELSDRYGINEIPTVIFFKNGRPTDRFTGFRSAEEIEAMITRI